MLLTLSLMSSPSPDAAILDRIQKLFQLADPARGATEHEIKTALEKAAQQLGIKIGERN